MQNVAFLSWSPSQNSSYSFLKATTRKLGKRSYIRNDTHIPYKGSTQYCTINHNTVIVTTVHISASIALSTDLM